MDNNFNNENNQFNQKSNNNETKNEKKQIALSMLCGILFILGLILGPMILKAASKNVSDGSFMHEILKAAGYNLEKQENNVENQPVKEINKFYFSTESNGYYYYYIIDENGDYIYYYSDNNMYDMHWYATDANGRYVGVPYEIYKYDYESPNLYLYGDLEMILEVGTEYVEPGYSAYDSADGNLIEAVVISGNIDASKPGEYILVYTVKDKTENSTTKVRKITYREKEVSNSIATLPVGSE
jgi:hypothetical protein